MERVLSPILAVGLILGTLTVQAAPAGSPQNYALRTKYRCQANGILVRNKKAVVSSGQGIDEVSFEADPGDQQSLTFGRNREYMVWPRAASGSFRKSLNVLSRDSSGAYKIVQEVDMGDTQITKTNISFTAKDKQGDERPISCRIDMEWVKKTQ